MAISTLILAGGRGSRMGGCDKGLMPVAGKPAIEHLLERLYGWHTPILISANRNLDRYANYGHPVITDGSNDFPGPLAGILAGMRACKTRLLLTLPVDAPLVSSGFLARMETHLLAGNTRACVAGYNGRMEPVFCLLDCSLAVTLAEFLASGQRSAADWLQQIGAATVDCSDMPDQFINLNCAADFEALGQLRMNGD